MVNYQKLTLSTIFLLLMGLGRATAFAQEPPTAKYVNLAKDLKATYPDAELVALEEKVKIKFEWDEETGQPIVREEVEYEMISLEPFSLHRNAIPFDEQSKPGRVTVGLDFPRLVQTKDVNLEIDGIFYSDAKLREFNSFFYYAGHRQKFYYSKTYQDLRYLTTHYINRHYPIVNKEVRIEIPAEFNVDVRRFNFGSLMQGFDSDINTLTSAVTHIFTFDSLKAKGVEESIPGPSHVYPHILFVSKSFERGDNKIDYFRSTEDQYAWYRSLVKEQPPLSAALKEQAQSLAEGKTEPIDQVEAVYYWVQDQIRYIAFEDGIAGFKPAAADTVYHKRYGDCKGMANLTCQMLKELGFDARLTWVGTKRIAYDYSLPSLAVDNHMICTVFLDGEPYFLDPTEKYLAFGDHAERLQGRPALIEDGDQFMIREISAYPAERNLVDLQFDLKLEGETLTGKAFATYNGEGKVALLNLYNEVPAEYKDRAFKYLIHLGDDNIRPKIRQKPDVTDRSSSLHFEYDLEMDHRVHRFGDQILIELDPYEEFKTATVEEDRELSIDLGQKRYKRINVNMQVPPGYEVVSLPKPISAKGPAFDLEMGYEKHGNTLVYKKSLKIRRDVLRPEEFESWNQMIDNLKSAYNEPIVLQKIH